MTTFRPSTNRLSASSWTGLNLSARIDLPQAQNCPSAAAPLIPLPMADFLPMLQAFVERAPGMCPFQCDGDPLTCTVAIVGVDDPGATTSFWPFWSAEKGMDRRSWARAERALQTGAIDGVQARLERFLPQIAQRVIELNVPATQIHGEAQPGEDYRAVDILQFILDVVKPHTVICVGSAALRVVHSVALSGTPTILATREFIDWDIDYECALAEEVNHPTAATTSGLRPRAARSMDRAGAALRSWLAGLR